MTEKHKLNLEFPASARAHLEAVMEHLIGADARFIQVPSYDRFKMEQFHTAEGSLPYALRTALTACAELIEQIKKEAG